MHEKKISWRVFLIQKEGEIAVQKKLEIKKKGDQENKKVKQKGNEKKGESETWWTKTKSDEKALKKNPFFF